MKKSGTSRYLHCKEQNATTRVISVGAEPILLESDESDDPGRLCWRRVRDTDEHSAGSQPHFQPYTPEVTDITSHTWSDAVTLRFTSVEGLTRCILVFAKFQFLNKGHKDVEKQWNHGTERLTSLIFPPRSAGKKAPALKAIKPLAFDRQFQEQKVTKVVFRSTCVSLERVNLLKQKSSACRTLRFFWQVYFLGAWALMFSKSLSPDILSIQSFLKSLWNTELKIKVWKT